MDFDDIGLASCQEQILEWACLADKSAVGIRDLANRYRQRNDAEIRSRQCGSFNYSYRVHWDDGGEDWLLRFHFPVPGRSMFLEEKKSTMK